MKTALILRIVCLVFAILCAAVFLERLWSLAAREPRVPGAENTGPAGIPELPGVDRPLPDREPPYPLRRYTDVARGDRFRWEKRRRTPSGEQEKTDGVLEDDRIDELTVTGIIWDDAGGTGLVSVVLDNGERAILAPGESLGEYRVLSIDGVTVRISHGGRAGTLKPKPPLMEKTHSGPP